MTAIFGDVIELLQEALDMAQAGKLRAVAIAGLTTDQTVMTAAANRTDHCALVGAIAMLQHDVIEDPNA